MAPASPYQDAEAIRSWADLGYAQDRSSIVPRQNAGLSTFEHSGAKTPCPEPEVDRPRQCRSVRPAQSLTGLTPFLHARAATRIHTGAEINRPLVLNGDHR